ncbi:MAG: RNA polymerase sigma factor, partial [Solirubrobacteraceae bacterium]
MIRSDRTQLIGHELSPGERGRRAAEAAWRIEWPRLVAGLTRLVGDIDVAEDLAQDALVAALEQWPRDGVPPNPGAWLMLTAKHRAIDRRRRDATFRRKLSVLGGELVIEDAERPMPASLDPDYAIEDDLLRMVFTACHPVLSPPARVALTLRMVGGLTSKEIARAYVVPESTVAQRIVRAKRALESKRIPFAVPDTAQLAARLDSVLEVIYLIFNEGYAATAGGEWVRVELVDEALRFARILTGLMSEEPEVHGLAALLELQASRVRARTGPSKSLVLLADQNRSQW